MFKKVKATETKLGRVIRYSSSGGVNNATLQRIQTDKVIAHITKNLARISKNEFEITVPFEEVSAILDDLRTADPAQFDKWLEIELQSALSPRPPLNVPEKYLPKSNPF